MTPAAALRVTTPDGIGIMVRRWGDPSGPAVIFLHGFSQCHLSWMPTLTHAALSRLNLIAYDLRGHGASGKPLLPEFYRDGRRWADELRCVIDATANGEAVLVAWSYAGRIVADYLDAFGTERLAGINLVGSKTCSDPSFQGHAHVAAQQAMVSDDLEENIEGTMAFLRCCAARWDPADFNRHLAFNMAVPAEVRRYLLGRSFDADAHYRRMAIPVLFTHGEADLIVNPAASHHGHAITPGSRLEILPAIGHSPFLEAADAFAIRLRAFVTEDCGLG